jgi:hypothetical protein
MRAMDTAEVLRLVDGVVGDYERWRLECHAAEDAAQASVGESRHLGDVQRFMAHSSYGQGAAFLRARDRAAELRRVLGLMAEGK